MYIYLDESGDLGFSSKSSKFFVIALLYTNNPKHIRRILKKVRRRLLRKKYRDLPEFKSSRSDDFVKKRILEHLSKEDVEISYVILRKSTVYSYLHQEHNVLYNYLTGFLVERLPQLKDREIMIVADKCLSKINREKFNRYLKSKTFSNFYKIGKLLPKIQIQHKTSLEEPCLQAVDYVANAVYRKYEFNDETYYNIIKPKIREEIIKW